MQGTTSDQDMRFSDKEKKILKSTKFPPNFSVKVLNMYILQKMIANSCSGGYAQSKHGSHQAVDHYKSN